MHVGSLETLSASQSVLEWVPNVPIQVCNSESVQMEANGPAKVNLIPFVDSICTELWVSLKLKNHCTINQTDPSLVSSVTPVKEVERPSGSRTKWRICIEPIDEFFFCLQPTFFTKNS